MGILHRSSHNFASGIIAEENLLLDQANPKSKIGYVVYDDSTVTGKPADGTGGAPSAVTVGYNSTPVAASVSSIAIQKSGVSGEGEGVGYEFTVPAYLRTKVLTISFDYNVNINNMPDGFFGVFIYDMDTLTLIEPTVTSLGGVVVGNQAQYLGQFQASATSTNYRLIFHCATSSTTALNMFVGNLCVGRQRTSVGAVLTDWQTHVPSDVSYAWGTVSSSTFSSRRIGSAIEVKGIVTLSSAVTGNLVFQAAEYLPPGLAPNTPTLFSVEPVGGWWAFDSSAGGTADTAGGTAVVDSSGALIFQMGTIAEDIIDATQPFTWANGDQLSFQATIPIQGWAGTTTLSSDTGQRNIVLFARPIAAQSIANNTFTTIVFDTVEQQTGGISLNTGTGIVTIQESGWYDISSTLTFTDILAAAQVRAQLIANFGGGDVTVDDFINYSHTTNDDPSVKVAGKVRLSVGDTIRIAGRHTHGSNRDVLSSLTKLFVSKIQGPQTHALPEFVGVKGRQNSGQIITGSGVIIWNTENYDTHNAYDTSTGVFTAPVSGYYSLEGVITSTLDVVSGSNVELRIRVNAVIVCSEILEFTGTNTVTSTTIRASSNEYLNAGDLVDFFVVENLNSPSLTIIATSYFNTLKIAKIG